MYTDIISFTSADDLSSFFRQLGFDHVFSVEVFKKRLKVVESSEYAVLRTVLDQKKVQVILNPHLGKKKDHLHYRDSGLNQVLCHLAAESGVVVAFTLSALQTPEEIGRVRQNLILCRKAGVAVYVFSFASHPFGMRSVIDLLSFCKFLGMSSQEAKEALSFSFETKS